MSAAMDGLSNYFVQKLQSKIGLSTTVIVGYAMQALFGIGATLLFFVALFFVFSDYLGFGATTTSVGMFLAFVLLLASAMLWTRSAKKKTIADAEQALQSHSFVSTSAPLVNVGMQVGRKVGWQRALPALLAIFFASGITVEWSRRRHHPENTRY